MNVHVPVLHANRYEEEKVTESVEKMLCIYMDVLNNISPPVNL